MPDLNFLLDQIVLSVFVWLVAVNFLWCIIVIKQLSTNKWNLNTLNKKSICVLVSAAIGLICVCYGFIEPYHLEVTKVKFKTAKMLLPSRSLRIVHLSDLHCDGIQRVVQEIPAKVESLNPDFVVFTGDACHNKKGLQDFRSCLTKIANICPTFAVKGNHDTRGVRYWNLFGDTGATELNCASKVLSIRNIKVWIGGVPVDSEACIKDVLDTAPKDAISVFLYHYPKGIGEAADSSIDLFCTGHTHGGQVRLPLYGALITGAESNRRYDRGLFDFNGTKMHISQGTGMTGVPIRFLAPPQITLIEIEPAKGP